MTRHAQKCPKQLGTLAVVVVRGDTGEPIKGATAAVKGPTAGSGKTDELGASIFKDRTPGSYSANVTMPPEFSSYVITKETPQASVSPGGSEVLIFKAAPVGNLLVEVYDDRGKLVTQEAELGGSGPAGLSHKGKTGSHTFASVAGGMYNVSARLPAALFEAPNSQNVVVKGGGTTSVRFDVKRRLNVVTPKIRMEYKVVVLDRKLSSHQEASEKKVATDDVTRVRVVASQSTGTPSYAGGGKFEVSPANVEVYTDKECKSKLSGRKLTNAELLDGNFELYLKASSKGKFTAKLTLDPADQPDHIEVKDPAQEEMGVVEIEMKLHRYEKADLDIAVHPDVQPYSSYWTELKDKQLPEQKALSDEKKVKEGRLLHVQADNNHARAKAVVQKLVADQWPAGTDDYVIAFSQRGENGSVKFFDKDWEGTEKTGDTAKVKVSELKAKEFEFWIEGAAATKKWRELLVGLDLDRADMDSPHTQHHKPKQNADWAHLTVVQIKEVKLDYTAESGKPGAWDEDKERFYINFKADSDGRKVTITAKLTEPIKDVALYFMLAEDANNMKDGNWGVGLPNAWQWKDITAEVKHKDKDDRAKLLHMSQATDDKGAAKKELVLSRFGGDVFHPAAYIEQDVHFAKYVHGQAGNDKRKPVRAEKKLAVWRKFWYREVKVPGINNPALAGAVGQYERVRAFMDSAPALNVAKASIQGGPAVYKRYMIQAGGGTGDALVISDLTRDSFFAGYTASAERPVEMPILIGDAYLRHNLRSGSAAQSDAVNLPGNQRNSFPMDLDLNCTGLSQLYIVKPCVNSASLVVSGTWKIYQLEPDNTRTLQRTGNWTDADITLDSGRAGVNSIRIGFPSNAPNNVPWDPAKTHVDISGLVIRGARSILGMSTKVGGVSVNVAVFDPSEADDFQNTIVHELGHAFVQVPKGDPANGMTGIPAHPNQADEGFGNHCRVDTDKCVMYDSGPIAGSYNRFCDSCHPYLLAQDMTRLK